VTARIIEGRTAQFRAAAKVDPRVTQAARRREVGRSPPYPVGAVTLMLSSYFTSCVVCDFLPIASPLLSTCTIRPAASTKIRFFEVTWMPIIVVSTEYA
jgi:hypothetical protein